MISARTRVYALLGEPVDHSLSPLLHNTACREAGVDGVYVALQTKREDLAGVMRGLVTAGGGGNVTLPHKERAATVLDEPAAAVRRTGACNTFWVEDGKMVGDNTDVEGFRRACHAFLGEPPTGSRVLLLGAGGAARATLVALLDDGVDQVCILNRSTERARNVSRRIGGERVRVVEPGSRDGDGTFDLLVNATSLGLHDGDPLPVPAARLNRVSTVMDLVYGPHGTALVRTARERGLRAQDGREMLLQQAAASFELWWDRPAPVEAMRDALTLAVEHAPAGADAT